MSVPTPVIIDISEHQKPNAINYDQLASSIDGAIVRIQYGSNYEDLYYKTHITELQKRGIPVAVYAWVRGVNNADMEQEAKDFYDRAKAYNPVFWWLDVEEQSMGDMRGGCEAYRVKLRNLGAPKVGVYVANHLFEKFNLNTDFFDGLWIPTYPLNDDGTYQGNNPTSSNKYHIHQYSSNGRRNGYSGALDMNRLVKGDFSYFFGGKKVETPKPSTPNTKGGAIALKTIKLPVGATLRNAPNTEDNSILAKLPAGSEVEINDIAIKAGFVWGIQPRSDGSKGYIDIGESVSWATL